MIIRKAKVSDIDKIYYLGSNVNEFQTSKNVVLFWPRRLLLNCVKSKTNFIIIAEDKNKVVGFIIATYNQFLKKAEIENLFIINQYRQQNVAGKLYLFLYNILDKLKCENICALVQSNNKPMIDFFLKHGFDEGSKFIWFDKLMNKSLK